MSKPRLFDPTKPLRYAALLDMWAVAFPWRMYKPQARTITCSPQDGVIGHCIRAQVWDQHGRSLADLDSTNDEDSATARAQLIAYALTNLLTMQDELQQLRAENKRLLVAAEHGKTLARAMEQIQKAAGVKSRVIRYFLGVDHEA